MFSQSKIASQLESLESRLCLSSTVALRAHQLHLAHLAHLQHQAVLAQADNTVTTGTTLSAHQRHLIHIRQLALGGQDNTTVALDTATTLSSHQRHLAHLRHLQVLELETGLVPPVTTVPVSTDVNNNVLGTGQSLFTSNSPIGTVAPVGTTSFRTGTGATIGTLAPVGTTAFATGSPIGSTTTPIGTIAPVGTTNSGVGTTAFNNNLFGTSSFDASMMGAGL